jgi:hypothetical protein
MKEGVLHTKLTKRPTSSDCNGEKKPDGGRLDHWTEGVLIVKTIALSKTSGNKTHFVALNRPIRMLLHFEHPFGINNIDSQWWRTRVHVSLWRRARYSCSIASLQ